MAELGKYDPTLQMFVESPKQPDINQLIFLRALAEANNLEHGVAGPPNGQLVDEHITALQTYFKLVENMSPEDRAEFIKTHLPPINISQSLAAARVAVYTHLAPGS